MKWVTLCLIIVDLINFAPIAGLLGTHKLESAYGITLVSNELIILMKHRALLFGLLGGFILYAAFVPVYQNIAMFMAAPSMTGFAILVLTSDGYNDPLYKVLLIDFAGLAFLFLTCVLKYRLSSH